MQRLELTGALSPRDARSAYRSPCHFHRPALSRKQTLCKDVITITPQIPAFMTTAVENAQGPFTDTCKALSRGQREAPDTWRVLRVMVRASQRPVEEPSAVTQPDSWGHSNLVLECVHNLKDQEQPRHCRRESGQGQLCVESSAALKKVVLVQPACWGAASRLVSWRWTVPSPLGSIQCPRAVSHQECQVGSPVSEVTGVGRYLGLLGVSLPHMLQGTAELATPVLPCPHLHTQALQRHMTSCGEGNRDMGQELGAVARRACAGNRSLTGALTPQVSAWDSAAHSPACATSVRCRALPKWRGHSSLCWKLCSGMRGCQGNSQLPPKQLQEAPVTREGGLHPRSSRPSTPARRARTGQPRVHRDKHQDQSQPQRKSAAARRGRQAWLLPPHTNSLPLTSPRKRSLSLGHCNQKTHKQTKTVKLVLFIKYSAY